jgi:hypothetical protein
MKRIIERREVIDCGVVICGKCKFLAAGAWCLFWDTALDSISTTWPHIQDTRCDACKAAEVKKP